MPTAKAMPEYVGPDYAIAGSWMRPCVGRLDVGRYVPEVLHQHIFVKMLGNIGIVSIGPRRPEAFPCEETFSFRISNSHWREEPQRGLLKRTEALFAWLM